MLAPAIGALLTTPQMPASSSLSRDEIGRIPRVNQALCADLIAEIRETHRRRQDFHRAEKSLTLQIKSIERRMRPATFAVPPNDEMPGHALIEAGEEGGEVHQAVDALRTGDDIAFFATLPLVEARAVIKKQRLVAERECVKLAKQLPVYQAFVEPLNGFGALGLAQIIGEAGDLSNYANPAKLWKRMGLAVINGKSQRRVAGAGAIEQGYSPVRRAIMFCIGDSLLKKQNAYRDLYLARKMTEQGKVPEGTKMLWHRRAQRYVEKRLLRDLWRAWTGIIRV